MISPVWKTLPAEANWMRSVAAESCWPRATGGPIMTMPIMPTMKRAAETRILDRQRLARGGSTILLRGRQQDRFTPRNHHRVFVMRCQAPVGRAHGPLIRLYLGAPAAGRDNRFNRNHQAVGQLRAEPGIVVIGYARFFVDRAAYPVAAQFPDHAEPATPHFALHRASNLADAIARPRRLQSLPKRRFRAPRQSIRRGGDLSDPYGHRRVGHETVFLRRDVQLHQVALGKHSPARNSVDGFVVDADTCRARKPVVDKRRRRLRAMDRKSTRLNSSHLVI